MSNQRAPAGRCIVQRPCEANIAGGWRDFLNLHVGRSLPLDTKKKRLVVISPCGDKSVLYLLTLHFLNLPNPTCVCSVLQLSEAHSIKSCEHSYKIPSINHDAEKGVAQTEVLSLFALVDGEERGAFLPLGGSRFLKTMAGPMLTKEPARNVAHFSAPSHPTGSHYYTLQPHGTTSNDCLL